jgi:hypothetical protein
MAKEKRISEINEMNVPRPTLVEKAREAVRSYLLTAEMLSPEEAPLNTLSVAHALGCNRKTLKKYGLDVEIARASERQARNGKISPCDSERRSYADKLHQRDSEIEALRQRCEALVSRVCLAEGNAQRLGIDPTELWKPLPVPDRSLPRTRTGRNRMGRSASA